MKTVMEICNVDHPNSVDNTIILNMYEGHDSHNNLAIAVKELMVQAGDLDGWIWRGYKIIVYLMGDYDYLLKMYGLSGANGLYPCLWCLTTKAIATQVPEDRPHVNPRSVETILDENRKFVASGSNLKNAKFYYNCIHRPFVEVPLDRVWIPLNYSSPI
ncbi:uncharacterized protein [Ptychodera flava]|uniref:uncharacterized protein n=1 Tax=Ptychodera flava TaxID=63121 RepID=UPI003969D8A7